MGVFLILNPALVRFPVMSVAPPLVETPDRGRLDDVAEHIEAGSPSGVRRIVLLVLKLGISARDPFQTHNHVLSLVRGEGNPSPLHRA